MHIGDPLTWHQEQPQPTELWEKIPKMLRALSRPVFVFTGNFWLIGTEERLGLHVRLAAGLQTLGTEIRGALAYGIQDLHGTSLELVWT